MSDDKDIVIVDEALLDNFREMEDYDFVVHGAWPEDKFITFSPHEEFLMEDLRDLWTGAFKKSLKEVESNDMVVIDLVGD